MAGIKVICPIFIILKVFKIAIQILICWISGERWSVVLQVIKLI